MAVSPDPQLRRADSWVRARALRASLQPCGPHHLSSPSRMLSWCSLPCRPWTCYSPPTCRLLIVQVSLWCCFRCEASLPTESPSGPPASLFHVPKAPAAPFTPLPALPCDGVLMVCLPVQHWEVCFFTRAPPRRVLRKSLLKGTDEHRLGFLPLRRGIQGWCGGSPVKQKPSALSQGKGRKGRARLGLVLVPAYSPSNLSGPQFCHLNPSWDQASPAHLPLQGLKKRADRRGFKRKHSPKAQLFLL